jgi:transaldolase
MAATFAASNGVDGRVSIEVDPDLANETDATTTQATDLWKIVDRPNVLIKIPATKAGLPSIASVTGEGVSVNVTLIFAIERYRAVIDAYMTGLERASEVGHDLSNIHSVASFFVSRVDSEVDKRLEAIGSDEARAAWQGRHCECPAGVCPVREEFERFAALEVREPTDSVRCGRRPGSRILTTPTPCTSPNSWCRTP